MWTLWYYFRRGYTLPETGKYTWCRYFNRNTYLSKWSIVMMTLPISLWDATTLWNVLCWPRLMNFDRSRCSLVRCSPVGILESFIHDRVTCAQEAVDLQWYQLYEIMTYIGSILNDVGWHKAHKKCTRFLPLYFLWFRTRRFYWVFLSVLLYYHQPKTTILLLILPLKITKPPKTFYRPKERGLYTQYPAGDMFSELWRSVIIILWWHRDNCTARAASENIIYDCLLKCYALSPLPWGIYCAKPRRPFTSPMLLPKVRYFLSEAVPMQWTFGQRRERVLSHHGIFSQFICYSKPVKCNWRREV